MNLLKRAELFMRDAFIQTNNIVEIDHHLRVVKWIKKLKPDADDALLIAGMMHDIERAFYGDWKAGSSSENKLTKHQKLSAHEAEKFLKKKQASPKLIERVTGLILHHETGGTDDQNVLCDADCLAWFEEKAVRNAKKYKQQGRDEEFRKKLDYILNRISSQQALTTARELQRNALRSRLKT